MAKKENKTVAATPSAASVKDYGVLISPIITEKSAVVGQAGNTLVFKVDPRATKTDIRTAVERIFSVKVEGIRTCTFIGKLKRTARSIGRRAGYKKAYITLAEGSKIDLIEGV